MRGKLICILALSGLLLLTGCARKTTVTPAFSDGMAQPVFPNASTANATDICPKDGYELEQMLIISRHNIRSPLSGGDSLLSQVTPHEWFNWTSESGELSVKGGQLESAMGQFFRKYLESKKFIPSNWIPRDGEVRFYTNSRQRTIATAQFFATGMLPVANVDIEYHRNYDETDPERIRIIKKVLKSKPE